MTAGDWRFFDDTSAGLGKSPLASFATDDTLCELVGAGRSPQALHAWVHRPSVILGVHDSRLPHVETARAFLRGAGYSSIVRNSGGLAVVLDEGVLNVSMALSEAKAAIQIDAGYERMKALVFELLPELAASIEAYEIEGSYCPGSYDLSVGGRKFAGMSQRRLRKGVAVQVYLCIEGSGSERAALIQRFYAIGKGQERPKFTYPSIRPEVMASASELLGRPLTVEEVVARLARVAGNPPSQFEGIERERYAFYYERIAERNAGS